MLDSKKGQNIPGGTPGGPANGPFVITVILFLLVFLIDGFIAGFAAPTTRFVTYSIFLIFIALYSYVWGGLGNAQFIPQLVCALVMFLIPAIMRWLNIVNSKVAIIVMIFYFVWLLVIFSTIHHTRTFFDYLVWILMVLIIILSIQYSMPPDYVNKIAQDDLGVDLEVVKLDMLDTLTLSYYILKTGVTDLFTTAWTTVEKEIERTEKYYGGDYYTARVDESKTGPKGVFLRDLQSASNDFMEDENVIMWATLEAQSEDPSLEKPFEINLSCYGGKKEKNIMGKINDQEKSAQIQVYGQDFIDLRCEIPAIKLEKGYNPITFDATFPFETISYLRVYFISEDKLRELRRQNVDPYTEFEIPNRYPITEYSSGPLQVGMGTGGTSLIAFPEDNIPKVRFGITLDNAWEGKLKKINDVVIKIPDGLKLSNCEKETTIEDCQAECAADEDYDKIIRITKKGIDDINSKLEKGANVFGFSCYLMPETDVANFMGDAIIKSHYLKTTIRYVYEVEESKSVNIKKGVIKCNEDVAGKECSPYEICGKDNDGNYKCMAKCDYYANTPGVTLDTGRALNSSWGCNCELPVCKELKKTENCIEGLCPNIRYSCCYKK